MSAVRPAPITVGTSGTSGADRPPIVSRHDALPLAIIFTIALVLRIVSVLAMRAGPLFSHPILDAGLHDEWARAVAAGESLFAGAYFRAPLYPAILGVLFTFFGPDYLLPRILQATMGALSGVLIYLIGRDLFNRAVGALAGLMAATYWVFIFFDGELLLEPLSAFLNLLALWLMIRATRSASLVPWMLVGLVFGLSAINRPNVLLFMPVVIGWLAIRRSEAARWRRRAIVLAIGCAIPIVPITVRNYVVGGDLVLISSQAGVNFYIGNNPQADGTSAVVAGTRSDYWGGLADWTARAQRAMGRKLKPSEVSRFYFARSWDFMRTQPAAAARLMLSKFGLYWYGQEFTNNKNLYFFTAQYTPWSRYVSLRYSFIVALAAVGLWLHRRDAGNLFPLWGFVGVYWISVALFFVAARFRVPAIGPLMVLAAAGAVGMVRLGMQRRWATMAGALGVTAVIALLTTPTEAVPPREAARAHCQLAAALAEDERWTEAESAIREALAVHPSDAATYEAYGRILGLQQRWPDAIAQYRRSLEVDTRPAVYDLLTHALAMNGDYAEAIALLREGVERFPENPELVRRLAWNLAACPVQHLRDGKEAVTLAEEALRRVGENPATLDTLAVALAADRRFDGAIEAEQRALDRAVELGDATTADVLHRRLQLFQRHIAYHEPRTHAPAQ